jgi:hypothetical protein
LQFLPRIGGREVLGVDFVEFGGDRFFLPGYFELPDRHVVFLDECFFGGFHGLDLHELQEGCYFLLVF